MNFKSACVKQCRELRGAGVYAIVHRASGQLYVGSTGRKAGLVARLAEHRSRLNRGRHDNKKLQNCFNTYGSAAFDFVVLELCAWEEAKRREQHHLDLLKPWGNDGFNVLRNAAETRPYSQATKEAMAARSSKPYALEFGGQIHTGVNLTAFCVERGLHQGAMTQVLLGKKPQFKGWTLPGKALPTRRIKNHVTGAELTVDYFEGGWISRQLGLNQSAFNKLLRGATTVYRGWHLVGHTPTEEEVTFSFLSKAELARVNGRRSALVLTGQPRRRHTDPLPHAQ